MFRPLVQPAPHERSAAPLTVIVVLALILFCGRLAPPTCFAEPAGRSIDTGIAELNGSITSILPADTMLWIGSPDWSSTADRLNELPMLRLLSSDEMKPFRDQTEKRSNEFLLDAYGLDFKAIDETVSGEFIVAGLTTEQGELSITCFVQTPNENVANTFIHSTAALLKERGAREETAATSNTIQLALKAVGEQLVLGTLGSHAMISGDVAVAANLINRWQQRSSNEEPTTASVDSAGNSRLVEQPEFATTIAGLQGSPPSLLRWYFDPIAFAVASEKTANRKSSLTSTPTSSEESSRIPFPMRHGFPGLKSVAGRAWINEATGDLESRTLIHAPTREEALEMFQFEPGSLDVPLWLTDEANVATIVRWNLDQMISNAEAVYDDVTDAPGAFAGTMQDLKTELKVDLLDGLFPIIGPELVIYSVNDSSQNNESTVVSIEIQDPAKNEKSVAAMMYNLLIGDPEARRIRLPGKRYEMWQIKLIVDEDTTPFSKAGLIVADGRLWFCTHASTLQKLVLQRKTSPLAETKVFHVFDKVVENERHPRSFGISIARMDRDAQNTYEVLRAQGVQGLENVESIYATLLRSIFFRDNADGEKESRGTIADEIDFSVLPSYEFARQYLKNLAVISRTTDTGWEIFAVVFDEESDSR